jgi:8-oxo-dGTP pyrophosphatase MutT (NUDIX family)
MTNGPELQVSAGGALLRGGPGDAELLVMRQRARVFELPKGHVEPGESLAQAAGRELCEETGLRSAPPAAGPIGVVLYHFDGRPPVRKVVHFFLFFGDFTALELGPRPPGTRELRWLHRHEIAGLALHSENLRPILISAFDHHRALVNDGVEEPSRGRRWSTARRVY